MGFVRALLSFFFAADRSTLFAADRYFW